MADTKISELPTGAPAVLTDRLVIARQVNGTWTNYYLTTADVAAGINTGVSAFNNRTGAVTFTLADLTSAAGYAQTGSGSTYVLQNSPEFIGSFSNGVAGSRGAMETTGNFGGAWTMLDGTTRLGVYSSSSGTVMNFFTGETATDTPFSKVRASLSALSSGKALWEILGYVKKFGVADVRAYGAIGDGTTDDTTAIQSALASGYLVFFPPGTYRITSALTSSSKDLTIIGSGPSTTVIKVDGAINGLTFTGTRGNYTTDCLVVRDIGFQANNAGALAAISATFTLATSTSYQQSVRISGLEIAAAADACSFLNGIVLNKAPFANVSDCYITTYNYATGGAGSFRSGSAGIQILGDNANSAIASDFEINACTFVQCETAIRYNNDATSGNNYCEGLHVDHAQIINCTYGVKAGNSAAAPVDGKPLVNVNNSYINASNTGIDIQTQASWNVNGCEFADVAGSGGWTGIKYTSGTTAYQVKGKVANNNFVDVGSGGTVLGVWVVGNASTNESVVIDNNTFTGMSNSCLFDANTNGAIYTATNKVITGTGPSNASSSNQVFFAPNAPGTITAATYTVADGDAYLIANRAGTVTLTLPAASGYPGRAIKALTIQNQTVVSASSNVTPITGGAAGTAILSGTAGKWAEMVSDGTNWQIMAAN